MYFTVTTSCFEFSSLRTHLNILGSGDKPMKPIVYGVRVPSNTATPFQCNTRLVVSHAPIGSAQFIRTFHAIHFILGRVKGYIMLQSNAPHIANVNYTYYYTCKIGYWIEFLFILYALIDRHYCIVCLLNVSICIALFPPYIYLYA